MQQILISYFLFILFMFQGVSTQKVLKKDASWRHSLLRQLFASYKVKILDSLLAFTFSVSCHHATDSDFILFVHTFHVSGGKYTKSIKKTMPPQVLASFITKTTFCQLQGENLGFSQLAVRDEIYRDCRDEMR